MKKDDLDDCPMRENRVKLRERLEVAETSASRSERELVY